MQLPEKFTDYARFAASQLRWKRARGPVERELLCHLLDQKEALMAAGMEEEAAEAESLRLTGDAVEIGEELDRIHRPKPQTGLLLLTGLLALLGLGVYVLIQFRADPSRVFVNLTAWVLGGILFAAVYQGDYTLLTRKPLLTYGVIIAAVLAASFIGRPANGVRVYAVYLSLLLPVGWCVLLCAMREKGWTGLLWSLLGLLPPMLAAMAAPSLFGVAALALVGVVLLIAAAMRDWFGLKEKRGAVLLIILAAMVFCAAGALMFLSRGWMVDRLTAAFTPEKDPNGMGYQALLIRDAVHGARFFGEGPLSDPYLENTLFLWRADFLLTLLLHEVGWCSLLVIGLAFLAFFGAAFRQAAKLTNYSGRMMALAVLMVLLAETVIYLAANLGFVLLLSPSLPLVSPGSTGLVVNLTLIGLLLSTFRGATLPEEVPEGGRHRSRAILIDREEGDLVIRLRSKKAE